MTGKLVFSHFNLTVPVMRMGGGRAEIRGGAGLHSTQPGAEGTKEMLLKRAKRTPRAALVGLGPD